MKTILIILTIGTIVGMLYKLNYLPKKSTFNPCESTNWDADPAWITTIKDGASNSRKPTAQDLEKHRQELRKTCAYKFKK